MKTSLKETADKLLASIYSDNTINKKIYTELDALLEIENALQYAIKKAKIMEKV